MSERALDDWTPICQDVELTECHGVAALFTNNLARHGGAILEQSGGLVVVASRPECPSLPDWAVPGYCWQATAEALNGPVCMVIARHLDWVPSIFGFGQVGGDDLTGRATSPNWPTPQPCI